MKPPVKGTRASGLHLTAIGAYPVAEPSGQQAAPENADQLWRGHADLPGGVAYPILMVAERGDVPAAWPGYMPRCAEPMLIIYPADVDTDAFRTVPATLADASCRGQNYDLCVLPGLLSDVMSGG
jgi:hypothetical protein